ncbi:MAG: hypothetical protein COY80_00575 [Candidatus Pacebacteria bacterium CG_4_10_14_0_8_um_filter_42_14]|nr:MAG: hypothetical protein COY80_00575 [Candidatus Pacebacteria bacterium CG_4_10_14_0_8_um_filter_42_14]
MNKKAKQPFNLQLFLHTRRSLAIAIGLVLASVILLVAVCIPQIKASLEVNTTIAKENERLTKLKQKFSELSNITYQPEYEQIDFVSATLPSHKPLLELITSLYAVTQKSGVVVSNFEISPGLVSTSSAEYVNTGKGAYDSLELKLSVGGTYDQLQQFMLLTETVTPFTTISELSLNATFDNESATVDQSKASSASLVTTTFFFTQPISVSLEQPLPKLTTTDQIVLNELASFEKIDLPEQNTILGGGSEDIFRVAKLRFPGAQVSSETVSEL